MNTRSPRVLLLALPLLILAACQHPSTYSSNARAERPTLADTPAELATTERPARFTPAPSLALVTVDKGELQQLSDGYLAALGMVARLNKRVVDWVALQDCQRTILATGNSAKECGVAK